MSQSTEIVTDQEHQVLDAINRAWQLKASAEAMIGEALEAARHAGQMMLELKLESNTIGRRISVDEWLETKLGEVKAKSVRRWSSLPKGELNVRQEVLALGVVPQKTKPGSEPKERGISVGSPYLRHLNGLCEYLNEQSKIGFNRRHQIDFAELRRLLAQVYDSTAQK